MELKELGKFVFAMFEDCERGSLKQIQLGLKEGADSVVNQDDIRIACEVLVEQGMIEADGPDAFKLTAAHALEREVALREFMVAEFVKIYLKRLGK
jgi:hypothetical protein